MDDPTDEYPIDDAAADPDRLVQGEAIRFVARRALIWFVPLVALGVLLAILGLPTWIVIAVVIVAFGVVIFELDL